MSSLSSRIIVLRSSDGLDFSMEEDAAKLSLTLKRTIEESNNVNYDIDFVKGVILEKVVDYCQKHIISKNDAEALELFDQEFVRNEDEVSMMYLANAAKDLEIESLFELCYPALIDKLKAKPMNEIADRFLRFVNLLDLLNCYLDLIRE